MSRPDNSFRFRELDAIGAPDAVQDQEFLAACFVDTGLLDVLRTCSDSRRVVVGRTGSGKTALLQRMQDSVQNVIVLNPEQLAIGYIANSNILQFLTQLGVKLDLFYRLLWRHVLIVEILGRHSALDSELSTRNLIQKLKHSFNLRRQTSLTRALEYMQMFGGTFWQDTDYRIREVTSKLEQDITASVGATLPPGLTLGATGSSALSQEQKATVTQRAQSVVNTIQARELAEMIGLLDAILDDPQQQFYVVIDRLDEDWSHGPLRYALTRALLETVREFHRVRNAKIIVALRTDLIDRVFRNTRDAGFQEEKYEGELVRLNWDHDSLIQLLDLRVNHLVRRRYTNASVSHRDVMPRKVAGTTTADFLIERTLMRPRDLIHFFNTCIRHADGKPQISERAVLQAEGEYSRDRLRALADEWHADYPNLMTLGVPLLKTRPQHFTVGSVTEKDIADHCLGRITAHSFQSDDVIVTSTLAVAEGRMSAAEYWLEWIEVFYRIGMIGLRPDTGQPLMWSYQGGGRRSISTAEIHSGTRVAVHPCFWRVLGTVKKGDETAQS